MIRVLHVFGRLGRGGAESRTMDLYRAIDRNKVQFDFMVHTQDHCAFDDEVRTLGGHIFSVPRYKFYNHWIYRKAWRLFLQDHEYKIVHVHATNMAGAILPELVRAGVPMRIVHARSASNLGLHRQLTLGLYRGRINRLCTHKLAVSSNAAAYLYGKRVAAQEKVAILPNAINANAFVYNSSKREKVRAELGVSGCRVVGHVGNFFPYKNHVYLLEAFARFKTKDQETCLILVGDGSLRPKIEQLAQRLEIYDKVIFLGTRNDVPDLMQAFDVLMLPSLFEGMPGVVIEAQTAGLPCLISNMVTRDAAIVPGLCDFLPISDEDFPLWGDAFEKACGKVRANTCEAMKKAGFDVQEQVKWYERLYISVTAPGNE